MRFDLIYASVGSRAARHDGSDLGHLPYRSSTPSPCLRCSTMSTFMKVEKTAYLKIRFDWLFSIYVVFVVAVIARYIWLCSRVLRGTAPEEFDPTKAGSGV